MARQKRKDEIMAMATRLQAPMKNRQNTTSVAFPTPGARSSGAGAPQMDSMRSSLAHDIAKISIHSAQSGSNDVARSDSAGGPARGDGGGSAPAATPSLSLSNDLYADSGTTSHKNIRFNVTVPSGLTATDYCLVNKLQGSMRKADGSYHRVRMYGSLVDFNFGSEQVDSVDADPVYWSSDTGRWNYTTAASGFSATDDPGPPGHAFAKGDVAAVKFKIGLYTLAGVPTTTTGSLSASPIQELPWQYSVAADSTTGTLSHPTL
jgi:hypothetical protein